MFVPQCQQVKVNLEVGDVSNVLDISQVMTVSQQSSIGMIRLI